MGSSPTGHTFRGIYTSQDSLIVLWLQSSSVGRRGRLLTGHSSEAAVVQSVQASTELGAFQGLQESFKRSLLAKNRAPRTIKLILMVRLRLGCLAGRWKIARRAVLYAPG